jgi:hypothetical protein
VGAVVPKMVKLVPDAAELVKLKLAGVARRKPTPSR